MRLPCCIWNVSLWYCDMWYHVAPVYVCLFKYVYVFLYNPTLLHISYPMLHVVCCIDVRHLWRYVLDDTCIQTGIVWYADVWLQLSSGLKYLWFCALVFLNVFEFPIFSTFFQLLVFFPILRKFSRKFTLNFNKLSWNWIKFC